MFHLNEYAVPPFSGPCTQSMGFVWLIRMYGDPSEVVNVDAFSEVNRLNHPSSVTPPGIGSSIVLYGMMSQLKVKGPSSAAAVKFWNANTIGNDDVKLYVSFSRGNKTSISKAGRFDVGVDVCADDAGVRDAPGGAVVWAKADWQAAKPVIRHQA
jgi:hypothetical protein